jgi:DNA-directed RNA polymerase subunit L
MNFENRLGKVLSEDFNLQESQFDAEHDASEKREQFLQFLNAIVTSSDHARSEQALQRAAEMDSEQLGQIVAQTEALGVLSGLSDYISSKPSRIMGLIQIARILFQEGPELEGVVDKMIRIKDDDEVYDKEGDFYYDQGDDSDGH